jgi:hypothetical protein
MATHSFPSTGRASKSRKIAALSAELLDRITGKSPVPRGPIISSCHCPKNGKKFSATVPEENTGKVVNMCT